MNRVDIARFEFDFDTTWAAFFTDANLRVYSRYGGRDEHEPESRLSKSSLLQTMRESLAAHRVARDAAAGPHADMATRPPLWQPEPKTSKTPMDIPLLRKGHQGCVHCHQVREYTLLQAFHDRQFTRDLLFTFPLPESLGLEIDRAHGHRISHVRDGSPAADAKLRAGDVLRQCDDVPIRSELDLRWALHRLSPSSDRVTLAVERSKSLDDEAAQRSIVEVSVALPVNWRQSELSWRKSSRSVPADWGFRAAALARFERREAGLPDSGLAIRVLSIKPRGLAQSLGLQKGDVIVAVAGDSRERSLERLRSDLLRRYAPGDEVWITVRRGTNSLELQGPFPDWFTEETTVP